jgi:hypothetical protein
MMKKVYHYPPPGYQTFLTDKDGLSAKDYLLIISTSIFFLFISIGLVLVLFQKEINEMYLHLLDMVVPVVMTVVGGVMGVQAVETFSNRQKEEPPPAPPTSQYIYTDEDV